MFYFFPPYNWMNKLFSEDNKSDGATPLPVSLMGPYFGETLHGSE